MYRFILLALCLVGFSSLHAQTPVFKKLKHNFGKIKQNKPVTTQFSFTNSGDKPLIIETATAECGCTTPDYPKGAITKGKSGTIKVEYNAAAIGTFNKKITIKFLNIQQPVILYIQGEVIQ